MYSTETPLAQRTARGIEFAVGADFFEHVVNKTRFCPVGDFDLWNLFQSCRLVKEVGAFFVSVEIHQSVYRPRRLKSSPKIGRVLTVDVGTTLGHGSDPRFLVFGKMSTG